MEHVAELGSMHDAATSLGVDEDMAWNYLVAANNLSDIPLLRPVAKNMTPTPYGRQLLGRPENLERAFQQFLNLPEGGTFRNFSQRHRFLRRLEARTSARNQFYCQVGSAFRDRVNAVINLELGGGDQLTAHITTRSAVELGLLGGRYCHALIDPAWVEVRSGSSLGRTVPHNCLRGRVVRCEDDPVDGEVAIELVGGRIVVASMTHAEMVEKDMCVGRIACAVIQSSQIILAVDEPAQHARKSQRS